MFLEPEFDRNLSRAAQAIVNRRRHERLEEWSYRTPPRLPLILSLMQYMFSQGTLDPDFRGSKDTLLERYRVGGHVLQSAVKILEDLKLQSAASSPYSL
jgi:hypothetical protein